MRKAPSNNLLGALGRLVPYLDDERIIEVSVNGPGRPVFVERFGEARVETDLSLTQEQTNLLYTAIAAQARESVNLDGRSNDEQAVILSALIPALNERSRGHRAEAVAIDCALSGPVFSFRRLPTQRFTLSDYVAQGSVPREVANYLERAILDHKTVLLCGGTSSGKTTFLNALIAACPRSERILAIEKVQELFIDHPDSFVLQPKGRVGMTELTTSLLRHAPSWVVLGEMRGSEGWDFVDRIGNSGHSTMATLHANSAQEALSRLENMVQEGRPTMPLPAIQQRIAGVVDIVVSFDKTYYQADQGSALIVKRGIKEVIEVAGIKERFDSYCTYDLRSFWSDSKPSLPVPNP